MKCRNEVEGACPNGFSDGMFCALCNPALQPKVETPQQITHHKPVIKTAPKPWGKSKSTLVTWDTASDTLIVDVGGNATRYSGKTIDAMPVEQFRKMFGSLVDSNPTVQKLYIGKGGVL